MKKEEILKRLIVLLALKTQVPQDHITEDSFLGAADEFSPDGHYLNADSLDQADIVLGIEHEFELDIPDEDAERFIRVGNILDYVYKKLSHQKAKLSY